MKDNKLERKVANNTGQTIAQTNKFSRKGLYETIHKYHQQRVSSGQKHMNDRYSCKWSKLLVLGFFLVSVFVFFPAILLQVFLLVVVMTDQ
jgi:hypothetical protein